MNNEKNPLRFLNITAGIFLIGFMLYWLKEMQSILLPFFIALILFFVFLPVYSFLIKKRVPSAIAVILILLTVLVLSNTLSVFLIASINSFTMEFPKYEERLAEKIDLIITSLHIEKEDVDNFLNKLPLYQNIRKN
jgi:predicted PurR-regulated permease PerM